MSDIDLTPQQEALLGYMEWASEERWCAGWLIGLHTELLDDGAYEWLVEQAGGWWSWEDDTPKDAPLIGGRPLTWNVGSPGDLRKKQGKQRMIWTVKDIIGSKEGALDSEDIQELAERIVEAIT